MWLAPQWFEGGVLPNVIEHNNNIIIHSAGPDNHFTLRWHIIWIVNEKKRFYIQIIIFALYQPIVKFE